MKNYVIYFLLIISISNKSISSVETYEENYSCALDMLTITSLIRLATLESELDVKREAVKHNTLWEAITLSLMTEEEINLIKRKEKMKDDMRKRIATLLIDKEAEYILSGDFLKNRVESCLGDTTIQKVFNLYHIGIRDYG